MGFRIPPFWVPCTPSASLQLTGAVCMHFGCSCRLYAINRAVTLQNAQIPLFRTPLHREEKKWDFCLCAPSVRWNTLFTEVVDRSGHICAEMRPTK